MRDRAESPVAPTEVLYVDSDEDFAQLVERSLTRLDPTVSVTHVDSAAAAFAAIAGEDPSATTLDGAHPTTPEPTVDCVVSAYTLRETDAVSFLESFRRSYPDLPFVLFTGAGSESVASDAIAAGVSAYVPVRAGENNFELLAQRIWTVTQGYRAKRRAEATAAELRRAYHRTGESVVAVDDDSTVLFGNETFLSEFDVDGDEVAGASLWQAVPAFAGTAVESATRRVVDSREPETVEVETDDRVLSVRVFPDDDGGAIVYADDVTTRERTAVRHDCQAAVADGVGTPALVVDETSTVLFANDPARRRLGVSPRPRAGDGPAVATLVAEPDTGRVDSAVQTVLGRARRDGGVTTADGSGAVSESVGETTRVVEAVGFPSAETVADVRVEPVTVADEPHALVAVVDRER
ncbi:PAS domain-containing protein [Halobaculum sp. MBLA0143]|uniref:PAS domain-containing protein n=1 Tax=Halobaculum sp. MBLA0143 TaxID=3079933 RepID=UPI003526753F